jgi:hypothetical protein
MRRMAGRSKQQTANSNQQTENSKRRWMLENT